MIQLLLAIIYLSFISLGLPDSILGSAWPSIYPVYNVSVSYAGIISMIISAGTIISSLQSDRLTRTFGTGKVTAISVCMTAIALLGFSISDSFIALCLWSIPYGLGAGSVDASLNNYVALHYSSKHMSWLHCMWGLGASLGPTIMSFALTNHLGWQNGYRIISILQIILTIVLFFSLPLWKNKTSNEKNIEDDKPLTFNQIIKITGVKEVMITFFCYCALETTCGLWASSYLALNRGIHPEIAASYASLFYIGITIGRAFNGFLTMKFDDPTLIRLGQVIQALGIILLILPINETILLSLILIGLGCAPVYPCLIHSTPTYFGADKSQAIIGVQMASAYVGTCLVPPIFGFLSESITVGIYPFFLLILVAFMAYMFHQLEKKNASLH